MIENIYSVNAYIYYTKRKKIYNKKKNVYLYEGMIVTNIEREEMYDCMRDILIERERRRREKKKKGRYLYPTKT
jgi:hypothetical protein